MIYERVEITVEDIKNFNDECIDSTCRYCGLNLKQHEDKK